MKLKNMLSVITVTAGILTYSKSSIADESGMRIALNPGIGVIVAGNENATGGFALSFSGLVGYKINDYFGVAYQNTVFITSFKSIKNIGVYDENVFAVSLIPTKKLIFDIGPSLDMYNFIFCDDDDICDRSGGVAPGANISVSIMITDKVGVDVSAHGSYINEYLYKGGIYHFHSGPIFYW